MPMKIAYTNVHSTPSVLITSRYKYFKLADFACRGATCCDNSLAIQSTLIEFCDDIRTVLKKPLRVNSAYRCPVHNKAVGGSKNSQHMLGTAVDLSLFRVSAEGGYLGWQDDFIEFATLVHSHNLPGCGLYVHNQPAKCFVHCDIRDGNSARWGQINGQDVSYRDAYQALLLKKF